MSELILGEKYRFKGQSEVLVFVGKEGCWNQFALNTKYEAVWAEVLDSDLNMLEIIKASKG